MMKSPGSRAPAPVCVLVGEIERLFAERRKPLSYTQAEALGLLMVARELGRAGRVRLSRMLGLGEQGTRSLIRLLERGGLVDRRGWGLALAPRARLLLESLRVVEMLPRPRELSRMGWERVALAQVCHARRPRFSTGDAVRIRDSVVSWGGLGAVVMLVEAGGVPRLLGGEGTSFEQMLAAKAAEALGGLCEGVLGFLGFPGSGYLWGPLYGFLLGVCGG